MDTHRDSHGVGLKLLEIVAAIAIIALIAFVFLPPFLVSRYHNYERNSSTSLKTLASAEADFRANDRDWNHVNDFWTADVKGLYTLTSTAVTGATPHNTIDPSIKLIELSVASADADGTHFPAGGENVPITQFAVVSSKAGYWFAALKSDLSTTPPTVYAQDTQGQPSMGAVHCESRFGFVALTESPKRDKYVFMINENNTVLRAPATVACRSTAGIPPGVAGIPAGYLNWPDEATRKSTWSTLD
jgi:type II secretory pathway pseudopilin PulG